MSVPVSVNYADPKQATTGITVELAHSQFPSTLPFKLRGYVPPNTWAIRMSKLNRLASRHYRPTFERTYILIIMLLTLLVPVMTYYVTLRVLANTETIDEVDKQAWIARIISLAITITLWIVWFMPMVSWKYLGKVRVVRLAEEWTKTDADAAPWYGAGPVWKATAPSFFKSAIVLAVTVPAIKKSHSDRDSCVPPYVAAGDDALPPYQADWSRDPEGRVTYGELPMYNDTY